MRTVSNVIGRLLLLAAGGLIIFAAVIEIIAAVNVLNDPANGWFNFSSELSRNAMIVFLIAIANGIIGLTAFFAAIRGRRSFWLFIFALGLVVMPIYNTVIQVQAGEITWSWEIVGKLLLEYLTPVMYFVGCLLLVRVRRD